MGELFPEELNELQRPKANPGICHTLCKIWNSVTHAGLEWRPHSRVQGTKEQVEREPALEDQFMRRMLHKYQIWTRQPGQHRTEQEELRFMCQRVYLLARGQDTAKWRRKQW